MKLLLDTHTFIWWDSEPNRLSPKILALCQDPDNELILRARERIPSHFRIPSSGHLGPIFPRKILNVAFATPAVSLTQLDSIWPKSGREF